MTERRRPRLLLFDVDGTLIDAYGAGRRALEEAFAVVFGRDDAAAHLDAIWFAGKTDLFIFRHVAAGAGITPWEYERRYAKLEACYLERLRLAVANHTAKRILPGVEPLLLALTSRDSVTTGLMTGNLQKGARIKLAPFDLNRFFPSGGFGDDALERRDIGLVALRRFERLLGSTIRPEDVLVIGDTAHDIQAARACGFRVLAVGTGWTGSDSLRDASPDIYLSDLSDTAGVLSLVGL